MLFYGRPFGDVAASVRGLVTTVLFLDVIEHLRAPAEILAEVRDAFPKLRHVIVTVPARQEIWSNYDVYFGHFRRYDIPSFKGWGESAGLAVIEMNYFFHALYWPAWVLTKLGRSRSTQVQVPRHPRVHRFLAKAFTLEAQIIPGQWRGTSLLGRFEVRASGDGARH